MDLTKVPGYMTDLIVGNFSDFVREFFDEDAYTDDYALLDYIDKWLDRADGFQAVGGDYITFLLAVLLIIDAYEKDPSILDYAGDAVRGLPPVRRRAKTLLGSYRGGDKYLDAFRFHHSAMGYARSCTQSGHSASQ